MGLRRQDCSCKGVQSGDFMMNLTPWQALPPLAVQRNCEQQLYAKANSTVPRQSLLPTHFAVSIRPT